MGIVLRKSGKFGMELEVFIKKAYYQKNRGRICVICRKELMLPLIYRLDEYLRENGNKLKKSDIPLMRKIDSHEVCVDCYNKLLILEQFYITNLKNNCLQPNIFDFV